VKWQGNWGKVFATVAGVPFEEGTQVNFSTFKKIATDYCSV